MTPYDRAWDMGSYTEYMWVYDGICQVVRIPDVTVTIWKTPDQKVYNNGIYLVYTRHMPVTPTYSIYLPVVYNWNIPVI